MKELREMITQQKGSGSGESSEMKSAMAELKKLIMMLAGKQGDSNDSEAFNAAMKELRELIALIAGQRGGGHHGIEDFKAEIAMLRALKEDHESGKFGTSCGAGGCGNCKEREAEDLRRERVHTQMMEETAAYKEQVEAMDAMLKDQAQQIRQQKLIAEAAKEQLQEEESKLIAVEKEKAE